MLLPEVEAEKVELKRVGVDAAFITAGKKVLTDLGAELQETAEAQARREDLTRQVRAAESNLLDLLDELSAADDDAAVDDAAGAVRFPLEVLKSERARLGAEGDVE